MFVDDLSTEERDSIMKLLPNNIKRGDIVHIIEYGYYRNDGKLIYDGHSLLNLYNTVDEYGSDYWLNTIAHNGIVWIDTLKYRSQLLTNWIKDTTSFTTIHGTYKIRVTYEEEDDERHRYIKYGVKKLTKSINNGEIISVSLYNFDAYCPVYKNLYYQFTFD